MLSYFCPFFLLFVKPEKEQPFEASYLQFEFKVNRYFYCKSFLKEEKEILQTFGSLDFRIIARGADMYIYDIHTTGSNPLGTIFFSKL